MQFSPLSFSKIIHTVVFSRDQLITKTELLKQLTTGTIYCSYMFRSCKVIISIEVGECLLLFGAESFIFQFDIQNVKGQDI